MLTRDDIKEADDIQTEKVPVPEWRKKGQPIDDAFLWVRSLTGAMRDKYEASLIEARRKGAKVNLENMRAKLVQLGTIKDAAADVVNDESQDASNMFFADGDVEWLGRKNAAPIERLCDAIKRLSGMTDEDLEEIRKNLEKVPSDASS